MKLSPVKRFNNWLALKLGNGLGSMWFFHFCVILDLLELKPVIDTHSVIAYVSYISQSVIQLVALPILATQQKLLQANHDEMTKHIKKIHKKLGVK